MRVAAWMLAAAAVAAAVLLFVSEDPATPDPGEVADPPSEEAPGLMDAEGQPPADPTPGSPQPAPADPEPAGPARIPKLALTDAFEFRDGDRKLTVWRNPRVLLEFRTPRKGDSGPPPPPKPPVPGAVLVRTNRFTRIWSLPEGSDSQALADQLQVTETGDYSPAFHGAASSEVGLQGLPGGVLVQFPKDWKPARIEAWAETHELEAMRKMTVEPNWYVFETQPGVASLETANRLYATGEVLVATPNWWRDQRPR